MCAQFMIRADLRKLENLYGFKVPKNWDDLSWSDRIVPQTLAPVILLNKEGRTLRRMRFSLLPSWSKEEKVKFATHNARLETVREKPTWRKPFERFRCIVPVSGFIEPIYEGERAGHMVEFRAKSDGILHAAGIFDRWVSPEDSTKQIFSFAIITTDPNSFVEGVGHDRMPIFLSEENIDQWMNKDSDPDALYALLNDEHLDLEYELSNDRPMRPGWEKRK